MKGQKILVLGIDGMVGHTVFNYLNTNNSLFIFGTSRKKYDNKKIFHLSVGSFEEDFKKIPRVDYVINCIGALNDRKKEELLIVNTVFPQKLAIFLKEKNIKLMHISTDAVFDEQGGEVNETDIPNPTNNHNFNYAKSKLDGEVTYSPHITIRTSLLGLGEKGLLKWLLTTEDSLIKGFTNQTWSGCTSLQFAKLCEDIITENKAVEKISDHSLFHFSPLGPVSKFQIIKDAIEVFQLNKKLISAQGIPVTRFLTSSIIDFKHNPRYTSSVHKALRELLEFEKNEEKKISIYPRN